MRCAFALNKEEIISVFLNTEYYFVLGGHTENNMPTIYNKITDIPNLGISKSGDKNLDNTYLIVENENDVKGRKIERNDGTTVWAWDNLNIDAPIVYFGGKFKDQSLIGELSIQNHMSKESKNLYSSLTRKIQKISEKSNGVYIGKQYFEEKEKLTYSIKMNPEYDFKYI